jgi:hypothetical protein
MGNKNGSKWITRKKRLAIYLRDGMACGYCGATMEGGAMLTLDHVKPRTEGGDNRARNLITACNSCNRFKSNRTLDSFAMAVAGYVNQGLTAAEVTAFVHGQLGTRLQPFVEMAAAQMALRPDWRSTLAEVSGRYRGAMV